MSASDEQTLLKEIKQLVSERDSINDRLRTYRRGGRSDGSRFPRVGPSAQVGKRLFHSEEEKAGINKTEHKDLPSKRNYEKFSSSNSFQDDEEDFQPEKRPKVECSIDMADRNRRLLSVSVFGHLTSARDQLKKEEQTQQAQLQKLQMQRVEEKLQIARRNLIELRKRAIQEERTEDTRRAEAVQSELAAKETELLRVHLSKHYQNMKNFIVTKVQPLLFWLPAVMNERTSELRNDTISFINEKIQTIETLDFSVSPSSMAAERDTKDVKTRDHEDTLLSDTKEEHSWQMENGDSTNEKNEKFAAADENTAPNDSTRAVESFNLEVAETHVTNDVNVFNKNEVSNSSEAIFKERSDSGESSVINLEQYSAQQSVESKETNLQVNESELTGELGTSVAKVDKIVRKSPRLKSRKLVENVSHSESPALHDKFSLSREIIDDMTVLTLSSYLKEYGLSLHGKKGVLKERLLKHLGL